MKLRKDEMATLVDEKILNVKFKEFLDREEEQTNKPVRKYVEYLYKKFQKERRDSLSDWQREMLKIKTNSKSSLKESAKPVEFSNLDKPVFGALHSFYLAG